MDGLGTAGVNVSVRPACAVPAILGMPAVMFPPATVAVAADVLVRVKYPDREPVTFTAILCVASAPESLRVVLVAPLIATPSRYHWYLNAAAGDHADVVAVSVEPALAVPVILGAFVDTKALRTVAVGADVFVRFAYPVRFAVTVTEIFLPRSDDVGL